MKINSICVYCGSKPGIDAVFMESATILGRQLAQAGITLVYGGGARGIMGAVSNSVREGGGTIRGIIPEFLLHKEGDGDISPEDPEILVVDSMHERKQKMFELSDAFIALPGGLGTLEEIVEIMTWAQLGRHQKPIAFLNVNGFWDPMLKLLDHMKSSGFIHTANLVQPVVISEAENVIDRLIDRAATTNGL